MRTAVALLLALLVVRPAGAAEPLRPIHVRTPPVIDGRLDDEAWVKAPSVTGFKTWLPDYGVTMKDQTVAYFAYDAENLYFAFRAIDSEPSRIKASIASRDSIRPDDWICVNLDSFNDQQALYGFYVNPLGIQMDSRYAAGREDVGFDTVWYSAGAIDDKGYTIEMRIPFKSIRYRGGNPVTMGVVFERMVSRRGEDGTYPALDPKMGANFNIQMTPIEFRDIKHYTLLEVLPAATYSRQSGARAGTLQTLSSAGDLGVTARYGITAQLTAEGTYNPDFSQVESDAGQIDVNLRSPLFFAEKRPFFLEGQDVFNLGGPAQQDQFLQSIVHTRTIVNPRAGVKTSGKLGRADTLSALYAYDEPTAPPGEDAAGDGAHVAILRYKRALNQDAYLGGFYTGRERGGEFNRVAGVDGRLRVDQSSAIGFYAFGSGTRHEGTAAANGRALGADFMRETRSLTLYAAAVDISRDFATETGYLARNGVTMLQAAVVPRLYPKSRWVQRIELASVATATRDAFSALWESKANVAVGLRAGRATVVQFDYFNSTEVFAGRRFPTSGVSAVAATQVSKRLRLQGSFTRADAIYYSADPFGGLSTRASATITYQPSDKWAESLTAAYAHFDRSSNGSLVYDYAITRSKTTFQVNRYLFFRGIFEYNSFRRQLLTDLLASFTYIPGTVLHAGYGSLYEKVAWDGATYKRDMSLLETRRGLFFKASYLWRL